MKNLVPLLSGDADLWVLKVCPDLSVDARLNVKIIDLGFALKWGRPVQMLLCMIVLARLKITCGIDTVWVNGYPEIALMPWARIIGCRAIATRHLTMISEKPKWHWIRSGWRVHFVYELLARTANQIVCVSAAVADSLKKFVPVEKLVVISNWIPVLPELVQLPDSGVMPLRLLFVGRLIRHKGAFLILDAMRQLSSVRGLRSVSLTVVGDGEEREAWEKEAAGLNVEFAGFWSDTSSFYKRCDVFVNPTLGPEGLPLVSLDAMSYGLPCIFSDIPVHKEITQNGTFALLFKSGDPEDLKKNIERLLQNPHLVEQFGRSARKAAETNHGPDFARQRYVQELGL